MEVKAFLISFEKSLIANEFSPESARRHTLKVANSLKDTDKNKIHAMTDDSGVVKMARNYAAKIKALTAEHAAVDIASTDNSDKAEQRSVTATAVKEDGSDGVDNDEDSVTVVKPGKKLSKKNARDTKHVTKTAHAVTQKVDTVKHKKVELTESGKKNYHKWLMSKGILVLAGLIFAYIGVLLVYILIALLISVLVAFLVAVAAVGCIGTLAGLIYGVITLFSVVPEGIYEIGLALVIMAVTLALSIAIYNLAVRVVPILWKRFSQYLKEKRTDLRNKLNDIRTECNSK